MTTPRIEEMVEEFYQNVDLANQSDNSGETWLRQALTQAHQAGIDEAVERMEKGHICGTSCIYQCDYVDAIKAIKALQDNK